MSGTAQGGTAPRDFADMIRDALEASGLNPKDQLRALATIDNAAVYLHQADPANRVGSTALPGSISAEWNQLGITEQQADEMISKAITYTKERSLRPDQVADRLAEEMTRDAGWPSEEWEQEQLDAPKNRDTSNDYAEAYADVANDPTLAWRLEEDGPVDILADVKRQVHEQVFGTPELDRSQTSTDRSPGLGH